MLIPTGFWSYTTSDDTSSRGKLSQLRALLSAELQQQVGREPKVNIFQDVVAIPPGREWERQIDQAIAESSFIIPIVTPGFLQSEWCCREVVLFKEREARLGVRDLVFPIHYVDTEHLNADDAAQCRDSAVLAFLRTRQWVDFRHLRFRSQESEEVALVLENLAKGILKALRDVSLAQRRAEEQRRKQEAEALRRAEEQRQADEARQARLAREQRAREEAEGVAEEMRRRKAAETAELTEARRQKAEAIAAAIAEKKDAREANRLARSSDRSRSLPRAALTASYAAGVAVLVAVGGWMLIGARDQKAQVPAAVTPVTALERYEQAAASGNAAAMEKLGTLYRLGDGVSRDFGKASEWYTKAVDAGDLGATYRLGRLYFSGLGVPRDYGKAFDLFKKGATLGIGSAMNALGYMYATGLGVSQNYPEAKDWFERGVRAGDFKSKRGLANIYALGLGVPQDEAKAESLLVEARADFERAAMAGDPEAMASLGSLYLAGIGGAQDEVKAREWLQKGAAAGEGEAMYSLGYMCIVSKPPDLAKAVDWTEKGAAAGSSNAIAGLGLLHEFGEGGLPKDRAKAHELLEEGAAGGSAPGMANLASLYETDTPPDYEKAREWYERAAILGGFAMKKLADLYEKGLGGPKDEAGAQALRQKATAATALKPGGTR